MAGGDNEQNLLNISTNLLFELNTSGRILYANRKAEQTWQISARKSLRLIDYLDALSVNVIDNALNRVITGNAPCNFIPTGAAFMPPLYILRLRGGCCFALKTSATVIICRSSCKRLPAGLILPKRRQTSAIGKSIPGHEKFTGRRKCIGFSACPKAGCHPVVI